MAPIEPDRQQLLIKAWEEAWRQFDHEDKYKQENNRFYISIEIGLITVVLVLAFWVLEGLAAGADFIGPAIRAIVFGPVAILISEFGSRACDIWRDKSTESAKVVRLHWINAILIEKELGIYDLGPASVESRSRAFSKANRDEDPFKNIESLDHWSIHKLVEKDDADDHKILDLVQLAWKRVKGLGIVSIVLGLLVALCWLGVCLVRAWAGSCNCCCV